MRNNVAQALDTLGLTGAEYGALDYISRHADPSNADLARYLLVTPQSLGKLTAGMRSRGLLHRAPTQGSHRYHLALTPDGQQALARARPHVEAAQQRLLAPLDRQERIRFARALTLCADHHDNSMNGQQNDN
ncbi:MarR family winged helix-turn-helix transcriptional regulator [Prauserella alba]